MNPTPEGVRGPSAGEHVTSLIHVNPEDNDTRRGSRGQAQQQQRKKPLAKPGPAAPEPLPRPASREEGSGGFDCLV